MEHKLYSMLDIAVRYWLLSHITIKSISASVSTTLSCHGDCKFFLSDTQHCWQNVWQFT